jgi:hypothetical protein
VQVKPEFFGFWSCGVSGASEFFFCLNNNNTPPRMVGPGLDYTIVEDRMKNETIPANLQF